MCLKNAARNCSHFLAWSVIGIVPGAGGTGIAAGADCGSDILDSRANLKSLHRKFQYMLNTLNSTVKK